MVLNLKESNSPVYSSPVIVYSCHFTVKDNVKVKVRLCLIQNKPTCRKIIATLNSYMWVDHYGTTLLILKSLSITCGLIIMAKRY